MPKYKEKQFLQFIKNKEGISVNIEDKTRTIDVLIGIAFTIDMIIDAQGITKKQVLQDINKILKILEEDNKNKKGEKENVSK